jgi:hypothetical protein
MRKKIIFLFLVILICLSPLKGSQAQTELSADKEKHQKYLYLFEPTDKASLIKTIEREGNYDFSILLMPKTEPVQERYVMPITITKATASYGAEVLLEDDKIYLNIPAASENKKIVLESDNLNIDTSIYPNFELIYNNQQSLDISLYFYVDIDNDEQIDFIGYFGKEPGVEIKGEYPAYEFNYYIKHQFDLKDKNIKTPLYNELRIHRTDRIFFKLIKLVTVINGAEKEVKAVINDFNLYNIESIPRSVFLINYQKAAMDTTVELSLIDYVKSSPELSGALSRPVCEYQGKVLKLEDLDDQVLAEVLSGRKEVKLGKFNLKKGEEFNLKVFENELMRLEAAYLAQDYKFSAKEPELTFKKVNPTRYIVNVRAWGSFWLTLNENYHSGWRAYVVKSDSDLGNEKFALEFAAKSKDKLTLIKGHQVVNAYANGWFVPVDDIFKSKDKPVEFDMVLEFYPQRLYEAGMIISSVAFAVMALILLIYGLKKLIKR